MFQWVEAATQIPSDGRLHPSLLVGGYSSSKALCWGRRSSRGRQSNKEVIKLQQGGGWGTQSFVSAVAEPGQQQPPA